MRAIKRALDPSNLLNPGKVLVVDRCARQVEPHRSAVMLRLISTVLSRRLIAAIPTLLMLSLIVFVVLRLIPADPLAMMLPPNATPADAALLRHQLGLDKPIPSQFLIWLVNALQGNLGASISFQQPVATLIGSTLPADCAGTLSLGARHLADHQRAGRRVCVCRHRSPRRVAGQLRCGVDAVRSVVLVGLVADRAARRVPARAAVFRACRRRYSDAASHRFPADRLPGKGRIQRLAEAR